MSLRSLPVNLRSLPSLAPDRTAPLTRQVGKLLPALSTPARQRIAEMALAMREAALNDGACEAVHLRRAGFTPTEIEMAVPLARQALEIEDGLGPIEAVPAFTHGDMRALIAFNAQHRTVITLRAA